MHSAIHVLIPCAAFALGYWFGWKAERRSGGSGA